MNIFFRRVSGESMQPLLSPGRIVVFKKIATVREQSVVIARVSGREVVKLAVKVKPSKVWLKGLNAQKSTDSRTYGWIDSKNVFGELLWPRYTKAMKKNHYWFKRKRYGWGWTPTSWQGFASIILLIAAALASSYVFRIETDDANWPGFLVSVVLISGLFSVLVSKKAPDPHWRWGKKESDKPDEDF